MPSAKKTNGKKKEEKEDIASSPQSTISGPEEPSLRNVVTAAEDFIKVLATVSTSQSSTAGSNRGETQSSEKKKKRKNTGKKNNSKKQKGKGKGRRNRKQKAEMESKVDKGIAASTSGSKGEVEGQSTFISASHRHKPLGKHMITECEPVRKEEPLNEVMKDEPATEEDTVSMASTPATEKKPETRTEIPCLTPVSTKRKKTKPLKQRESKKTVPQPRELPVNATDIFVPTTVTATRVSQPQQQSIGRDAGKQPSIGPGAAATLSPKVKRTRWKVSGDREWRKKKRKDSSASPTVPTPNENSPADPLKAIPLGAAPPLLSDRNEGRTIVRDVLRNASFSVLKTQKLKEKGLRSSRRKAGRKPSQTQETRISPPPQTSDSSHVNVSASSAPTEETQAHTERLSPTTKAPSVSRKRHRPATREQRRKRTRAPAVSDALSAVSTSTPPIIATAGDPHLQQFDRITASATARPILTSVQVSVERLKAQFIRKKRRKTAMRRQ